MCGQRKTDDKFTATSHALATRLDPPAVQLDDAAREREADADAARRAPACWFDLREHFEDRRQLLPWNPDAVVAHRDDGLLAIARGGDLDSPARVGVSRRIVDEIGEHLSKANRVAIDLQGLS